MIHRMIDFKPRNSVILLGPRLTGKSSLLKKYLGNKSYWHVDLLHLKTKLKYSKTPESFREDALFQIEINKIEIFFIDEIQKNPLLLDEIHSLIESHHIVVYISGSSPRKLKRGQANLLGGRVSIRSLMPFTSAELKNKFHLEESLMYGLLPGIYFQQKDTKKSLLVTYVESYIKEEIVAEGIVRNLDPFTRFLEIAASYSSQTLNYSNISRDSSVPLKTVQNYFEILEDTLIAYKLPAWDRSVKKQLAISPKFYFFDSGIVNTLLGRLDSQLDQFQKGELFEQFFINELRAYRSYTESQKKLYYWKTKSNNEVDLIIVNQQKIETAIEIKCKTNLSSKDFSGISSLNEDYPNVNCYLVYLGPTIRNKKNKICTVMNYLDFLNEVALKII